jgi:hypothetical protein
MGLYGNIVVVTSKPDYWPPVNRELPLTLDDILLEDGEIAPFRRSESTYTPMGRFGNVFLLNGEPRTVAPGAASRGRALLPDHYGEHACLHLRRARSADERH